MGLALKILGILVLAVILLVAVRVLMLLAKVIAVVWAVKKIVTQAGQGIGPDGLQPIDVRVDEVTPGGGRVVAHVTGRIARGRPSQPLADQYRSIAGIADAEWPQRRDRLLFVHDAMSAEMLREAAGPWLVGDEADRIAERMRAGESARQAFSAINDHRPRPRRLRRLTEFLATDGGRQFPVEVYEAAGPGDA